MKQEKNQFRLEVRLENLSPMKIDVIDTITAGYDPRNDLVLLGKKINPKHLEFTAKGENLALTYLGSTNQGFLNNLPLEEGRTYLLDVGDTLKVPGAEIIIRKELVEVHATQKLKPIVFDSVDVKAAPIEPESSLYKEETPPVYISVPANKPPEKKIRQTNLLSLWLVKFYSLVVDIFITYLILTTLLPLLLVSDSSRELLQYFSSLIPNEHNYTFFPFLIAWFILSFAQSMVFGATIGQFLVGLTNYPDSSFIKLVFFRIKTFLYSLLLLPAQNTYKKTLPYTALRKVGLLIILVFITISPFMLPSPFNASVTLMNNDSYQKELHTRTINSDSKELGMSLSIELPFRYLLLPVMTNDLKKRSFQLSDLKNGEVITIDETLDFTYEDLQKRLEFANPIYSWFQKTNLKDMSLKDRKKLIEDVLFISPIQLKNSLKSFGPFFGNTILLKNTLLDKNTTNDIVVKTYLPETPVLYFNSSQQDFFYLLRPDRMTRFVLKGKKTGNLLTVFEQEILSKFLISSDMDTSENRTRVSFLEVQDAFLHGEEQTILTYYVDFARSLSNVKVIHAEVDFTENAKLALVKNIEAVQRFITDKTVSKSLNDIKNQLAPMEKPGEKR